MTRTYPHMVTLTDYCRHVGIDMPRYPHFDIRRFRDNIDRVHPQMTPFRHECIAIALRTKQESAHKSSADEELSLDNMYIFFNSPFKLVSWDKRRDWDGYYFIFSQDFIAEHVHLHALMEEFSFLKLPDNTPLDVTSEEAAQLLLYYKEIYAEYHSDHADKFDVIVPLVLVVLQYVRRIYARYHTEDELHQASRRAEQNLFSRYKELIKLTFESNIQRTDSVNPHSTTYYAQKLSVHPNYLNAITKKMAGQTALHIIHQHLMLLAKTKITQTMLSMKEIAYELHFETPNAFSAFFKKQTGMTPMHYRNEHEKKTN